MKPPHLDVGTIQIEIQYERFKKLKPPHLDVGTIQKKFKMNNKMNNLKNFYKYLNCKREDIDMKKRYDIP